MTEWSVVASNGQVAMTFATKQEAEDAARWLTQAWGGERLAVKSVEAADVPSGGESKA